MCTSITLSGSDSTNHRTCIHLNILNATNNLLPFNELLLKGCSLKIILPFHEDVTILNLAVRLIIVIKINIVDN